MTPCPSCRSRNTRSLGRVRDLPEARRRRLKCVDCGGRFDAVEVPRERYEELVALERIVTRGAG